MLLPPRELRQSCNSYLGNSDWRFVKFGNLGLKLIDLLEVLFNAAVVVFFHHERDGAEISAAPEVLLTFGGEVDCGNIVIDVHRFNTATDVFYHFLESVS